MAQTMGRNCFDLKMIDVSSFIAGLSHSLVKLQDIPGSQKPPNKQEASRPNVPEKAI
jgi:hypothetical protein